jgi:nucleoside-diphosphate-sugar epimerase
MKVLVFGANSKTGSLVVEYALTKGHEITVLLRYASAYRRENVRILAGDATNREDVLKAVEGNDAVIDTIGGPTPYKEATLEHTAAHNIIEAMRAKRVRRLIAISMMGLGTSHAQAPFWYEHLLMPTFLRGSAKDKAALEQEVSASGLEFVIARPPILKDTPAIGSVMVLNGNVKGHEITRADLAKFLLDQLESNGYVGRAATVVNNK